MLWNNFIIGAWLSSWSQGAGSVWGQVHSLSVWCVPFLSERLLITLPKCTINRLDISVQYLIWCWRKYEAFSPSDCLYCLFCRVTFPSEAEAREKMQTQKTSAFRALQNICKRNQYWPWHESARVKTPRDQEESSVRDGGAPGPIAATRADITVSLTQLRQLGCLSYLH